MRVRTVALPGPRAPLLPALLVFAALLPQDVNIRPFGLFLTCPRLILLGSAPFIVMRLVRKFTTGGATLCDATVAAAAVWMFLSVSVSSGLDRAIVGASVLILELCGAYYLVRATVNRTGDAVALARWLCILIAINGVLSVLDIVTGRHILHELAQSVTGSAGEWRLDYRNGVLRAQGTLEHPILLGTVCCIGAIIGLGVLKGWQRAAVFVGCFVGMVASVSSAPLGGVILGCMLLVYGRAMPHFPGKWRLLLVTGGLLLGLLLSVHPAPFAFLLQHLTIDPETGYYRLMIWNLVGSLVTAHPWFGLGLDSDFAEIFSVANTVDSVWLYSALCFGIVGSVLIGLILVTSCGRAMRRGALVTDAEMKLARSLGVVVFLYIYLGCTVDYWGCTWILIGVVSAMRVHLSDLTAAQGVPGVRLRTV